MSPRPNWQSRGSWSSDGLGNSAQVCPTVGPARPPSQALGVSRAPGCRTGRHARSHWQDPHRAGGPCPQWRGGLPPGLGSPERHVPGPAQWWLQGRTPGPDGRIGACFLPDRSRWGHVPCLPPAGGLSGWTGGLRGHSQPSDASWKTRGCLCPKSSHPGGLGRPCPFYHLTVRADRFSLSQHDLSGCDGTSRALSRTLSGEPSPCSTDLPPPSSPLLRVHGNKPVWLLLRSGPSAWA